MKSGRACAFGVYMMLYEQKNDAKIGCKTRFERGTKFPQEIGKRASVPVVVVAWVLRALPSNEMRHAFCLTAECSSKRPHEWIDESLNNLIGQHY